MLTLLLLSLVSIIFIYQSYKYVIGRPAGFPPGPPRLPFFGSYLFLLLINYKYLHKAVLSLSKWYKSDIIGLYVGKYPVAVVHDGQTVREVLNNQVYDGRPGLFLSKMRDSDDCVRGIFFQEGVLWREQRRFILRYLRDFGFGRRFDQLENVIAEEITDMLDLIRNGPRYEHEHQLVKPGGYRIQLPLFFNPFSANSHFSIVYNERVPRAEMPKLIKLIQFGLQFQRNADDYGRLLSIMPWIRHIWPEASGYNKMNEANLYIYQYFSEFIDRHIDSYDESCERDFLDLYITEMKKDLPKESGFNRKQFIMALIDFSFPAFTAVGSQLSLIVQYLMLYPEVTKRIQREIDEVVGCGRLPDLEDRQKMPYTEATIRETMRIETLVPSDVPHKALEDTELMGYRIPKDTIVVPSLYAMHMDKRIWSDPDNFRPERFLDDQGKLCLKKDMSLPFGAGKRLCAGETFARNMLFLITTAMLQNFDYVLAPGDSLPDLSKNCNGLIITPPDFWVQLKER
ncbi:PREDICTED: probable cytochrome P450 304a1 [Drosophila arizonae]|uniref:Probable cytochrome P450 304a1 n=1 Tax=Drosophila arizonae TaxID=7263 RepID=A0ABM1PN27_DROAR|nr:PREDICTED: probable cytochrome P450 304a1 [Drosophila arizonae]XP_017868621.1 PREDICTED: probable cytochrome P450 304a1 [Drosophila arizonae]